MRVNAQTDYSLRILMALAVGEGLQTIASIATRYGISKHHLMKVANVLSNAQIIHAVRGRTGGLQLARPAQDITVGEVVRLMENDFALVECLQDGTGRCRITSACRLKGVFEHATSAFLDVLDEYTIGDLTHSNPKLAKILRSSA